MSANSGRDHEFANKRFDLDFTEENCHKVVGTSSGTSFYMQLADIDFFKSKVEFLLGSLWFVGCRVYILAPLFAYQCVDIMHYCVASFR